MTTARRQLRFGAFFSVPSCHPTGWRHPEAICETDLSFKHLVDMARMAERGKLDCLFFQDSVAIPGSTAVYGGQPFRVKSGRQAHIEPVSAIAALGVLTKHIGLISTCTTSYNEPYNVARRFLTIDHISGGRAGWNLVTSQAEDEAVNFGRDQHFEHGIRYERASEFHDVVVGLWDSWEDDAFLRDKASGQWFDYDKMHILNHHGEYFNVRGPLNVARSPQGRPVIAQAGSSDVGMELAARTADLIFTAQDTIPEGRAFRDSIHARMAKYGRGPDEIRVMPGLQPIVGRTMSEAQERYEELRALVDDGVGIAAVARLAGGVDIFSMDPDGPLPPLKPSNAARARQERIIAMGKRGLSIREIGRVLAMSQTHRVLWGTPQSIADDLHAWLEAGACDGFNLLFAHYPKPLEEWVTMVIPELQRRGIFRLDYEGKTFRDHLGVPMPKNRFATNRVSVAVPAAAASND
ncbi:MAG TPA: LLM class flavin-dependent oxidoreductase [Reyranella sp.]|nr:LLM class flavin-dependent oxidoreductase [Reyranella sp.]